ncbi:MAG: EAL domain-containing protein [Cellvibrionaceae bacterium]|nr:EAL domain-containing protein [Cellvibrionaceae bacterium]
MNLRTRTSLLLLPVIVISYALSSWWIYQQERETLIELETAKLEQKLSNLHTDYMSFRNFQDAYLMSLVEGDLLAQYLSKPDDIYRLRMLQRHMDNALKRQLSVSKPFLSILILNADNQQLLYLENSQDPFAQVSQQQVQFAQSLRAQGIAKRSSVRVNDNQEMYIYQAITLDESTYKQPLPSQLNEALIVVVTIKPDGILHSLDGLKNNYSADIHYITNAEQAISEKGSLYFQFKLKLSDLDSISFNVPSSYFDSVSKDLKARMVLLTLFFSLLTYLLLQSLVAKFITVPIADLDAQLDELIRNKRKDILVEQGAGEVGRLARKFQELYVKLSNSYRQSFKQAREDSLTGLANRVAFNEMAARLFERDQDTAAVYICYIDIDNFKYVNDKYGHEVGDRLLRAVSKRLSGIIEEHNLDGSRQVAVFRLSGDEFVILAADCSKQEVYDCAESVLAVFKSGFAIDEETYPVTVSIGLAVSNGELSFSELMSNVDLAMYQAKKSGKNCISAYSEDLAQQHRRMQEIELELKSDSFERELQIYYMPIVDAQGKLCALEALLRWNSETLGPVPPDEFIPLAESIGAFEKIDLWVISRVFKDFSVLNNTLPTVNRVSINISSAELNSLTFVDKLNRLAKYYRVVNQYYVLEVTETFASGSNEQVLDNLKGIRKLGFRTAIDDFGTGYTSLMQMLDYPVDVIKFDRSLIKRIGQQENAETARSLVNLCKLQGLFVVAEGIETKGQSDLFNEIGCDYQQGYFHGKPAPLESLQAQYNPQLSKEKIIDTAN